LDHASKPLAEQHDAFTRSISDFRGEHPQRDDITMFSFRVS
jgi:serine phosphatase RsbU (regulator of sigma subunit)